MAKKTQLGTGVLIFKMGLKWAGLLRFAVLGLARNIGLKAQEIWLSPCRVNTRERLTLLDGCAGKLLLELKPLNAFPTHH